MLTARHNKIANNIAVDATREKPRYRGAVGAISSPRISQSPVPHRRGDSGDKDRSPRPCLTEGVRRRCNGGAADSQVSGQSGEGATSPVRSGPTETGVAPCLKHMNNCTTVALSLPVSCPVTSAPTLRRLRTCSPRSATPASMTSSTLPCRRGSETPRRWPCARLESNSRCSPIWPRWPNATRSGCP